MKQKQSLFINAITMPLIVKNLSKEGRILKIRLRGNQKNLSSESMKETQLQISNYHILLIIILNEFPVHIRLFKLISRFLNRTGLQ